MPADQDLIAEGRARLAASQLQALLHRDLGCVVERQINGQHRDVNAALIVWALNHLPTLLDALEAAQRPPLGNAAGRCRATTVDPIDQVGRCLWCELPDGHAGKHHAERPQWAPTDVGGFMAAEPVLVDWPDTPDLREVQP